MLKIQFFSGLHHYLASLYSGFPKHIRSKLAGLCFALLIALAADSNLAASGTGLVGYWSFDEGTGDTAADFSGNENTGTLVNGPTWDSGKFSYGLLFDGIDDHVSIPHSDTLNLAKELTVSAWVSNHAIGNTLLGDPEYHVIASKGWAPDPGGSWTLAWEKKTNTLTFFVRRSSDKAYNYVFFDSAHLTPDWYQITAVFNNGKISLYVDGLLAAGPTSLGGSSMNMNTEEVRIGAALLNPANSIKSWDGLIDEVQIYNRALTDTEIKALFDAAQSQPPSDSSSNDSDGLTVSPDSSTSESSKPGRGNEQVATPEITPNGGTHTGPVTVTLKTATPGAAIYYTVDGTSPNQSSTLYKSPFTIAFDTAVKAMAFKQNSPPSEEASAWFTIVEQAFDFSLSNSGDKSTNKGSSAQNTISATLKSGKSQSISFGASGLPSGANASFSAVSCDPTCSSTLTITTDSSTPAGTYSITAIGSGGDTSRSTSFDLTVSDTTSFDFSLSNGGNKSVTAGSSVNNSINATLVSGTTQAVSFGISGLPSGTTGSFSPGSCNPDCSSTLTINTGSTTPAGTYSVTVSGSGGGVNKSTSFKLTVTLPTVATPTITPNGGTYSGSVSITMETATSGASIYYTTDGSTPTESSKLYGGAFTLTSSAVVKAKAFKSGYNPSAEASASFTITQPFDFSLSNGGNRSVTAGSSVTNTITANLVSGTTQAVSFGVSGLPSGTTASFSPGSCNPDCSSTLTINTGSSTAAGTYTVTVTAAGGGLSKSTTFNLTVSQPFDFSLSNGGNKSVTAGSSVSNTISATLLSGSTQPVTFSVSGLPSGATASFSAGSCSPTCSSILTISTSGSTPAGTATITVVGTGGGVTRSTSFSLTVVPPKLTVTWQDNSDNEDRFEIERKTGTGGKYGQIALVPANTTSYVDTNVTSGLTYCYRVRAGNSYGVSDYSNEACQAVP